MSGQPLIRTCPDCGAEMELETPAWKCSRCKIEVEDD